MFVITKRYRATLCCVALLLAAPLTMSAQSTSTATTSLQPSTVSPGGEWKPRNLTEPTARQQATPSSQAPRDIARARMTNLAANTSTRMERTILRLEQIVGRLQARISLIEASGGDVTQAKQLLTDAGSSLGSARNRLANIDEQVAATFGSSDPRTSWSILRDNYTGARGDIVQAHTTLVSAVSLLKQGNQSNATTTTQ